MVDTNFAATQLIYSNSFRFFDRLLPLSMTVPRSTYKEGLTTIRKKALESKLNEVTPTHLRPDQVRGVNRRAN